MHLWKRISVLHLLKSITDGHAHTIRAPKRAIRPPLPAPPPKHWPLLNLHLLIAIGTDARCLVVFGAVVVGTVVEGAVPLTDRSPAPLIHEMPIEAHKRPMLIAFVLQKRRALFDAEFFQVSARAHTSIIHRCTRKEHRFRWITVFHGLLTCNDLVSPVASPVCFPTPLW